MALTGSPVFRSLPKVHVWAEAKRPRAKLHLGERLVSACGPPSLIQGVLLRLPGDLWKGKDLGQPGFLGLGFRPQLALAWLGKFPQLFPSL